MRGVLEVGFTGSDSRVGLLQRAITEIHNQYDSDDVEIRGKAVDRTLRLLPYVIAPINGLPGSNLDKTAQPILVQLNQYITQRLEDQSINKLSAHVDVSNEIPGKMLTNGIENVDPGALSTPISTDSDTRKSK